ncbi:hypothetical protein Tco_0368369 [Tanacetum coccineum]
MNLSQPWVCAETDPFTSRIRHFDFPKTRMPSHVKPYNGSEDPEDHLKIFQAAAKTKRWAMPTWCHMFNSTLTRNARAWRHQEGSHRQNFKKGGGFRSQHKMEKRPDRFTLLTKTPKEILALEKGKFKTPPPMTTPVEKRNANKFCEFHGEVGHNTDECNHLRKQIEDMLKAGKLSHIIRELKQNSGKEQPKKKGETSGKEKPQAILMIQSRKIYGEIKWPLGQITLMVKVGDDEHSTSAWMDFMVVRSTSSFNGIIGRPGLRKMKVVRFNNAQKDKFPVQEKPLRRT